MWMEYSGGGFPLSTTDLTLRNKDWVHLWADKDVIASSFFRKVKNSTTPKFRTGKCTVFLHMPDKLYTRFEDWREEREQEEHEKARVAKVCH
jgi:hypothetical protein